MGPHRTMAARRVKPRRKRPPAARDDLPVRVVSQFGRQRSAYSQTCASVVPASTGLGVPRPVAPGVACAGKHSLGASRMICLPQILQRRAKLSEWPQSAAVCPLDAGPSRLAQKPVMEDRKPMRLKKLILHGFKSFADRTEFVFDSPITGIVGPNGCGKSNVVDGFKWVLGEQSAKSLRGDAMMDVIFNGAAARKPSGLAEVVLVFENPLREDNSRALNLDVEEVAVGRRLFRDGASEYQVNNKSTRLKDIRELF